MEVSDITAVRVSAFSTHRVRFIILVRNDILQELFDGQREAPDNVRDLVAQVSEKVQLLLVS